MDKKYLVLDYSLEYFQCNFFPVFSPIFKSYYSLITAIINKTQVLAQCNNSVSEAADFAASEDSTPNCSGVDPTV